MILLGQGLHNLPGFTIRPILRSCLTYQPQQLPSIKRQCQVGYCFLVCIHSSILQLPCPILSCRGNTWVGHVRIQCISQSITQTFYFGKCCPLIIVLHSPIKTQRFQPLIIFTHSLKISLTVQILFNSSLSMLEVYKLPYSLQSSHKTKTISLNYDGIFILINSFVISPKSKSMMQSNPVAIPPKSMMQTNPTVVSLYITNFVRVKFSQLTSDKKLADDRFSLLLIWHILSYRQIKKGFAKYTTQIAKYTTQILSRLKNSNTRQFAK